MVAWALLFLCAVLGVARHRSFPQPLQHIEPPVGIEVDDAGVEMLVWDEGPVDRPLRVLSVDRPLQGPFGETVTITVEDADGVRSSREVVRAPYGYRQLVEEHGLPWKLAGLAFAISFYSQIGVSLAAAALIAAVAPRHPVALGFAIAWASAGFLNDVVWEPWKLVPTQGLVILLVFGACVALLGFPDGRYGRRRVAAIGAMTLGLAAVVLTSDNWMPAVIVVLAVLIVDLAWQGRQGSPLHRQRLRWVLVGGGLRVAHLVVAEVLFWIGPPAAHAAVMLAAPLFMVIILGSVLVAVVRYRTWDLPLAASEAAVLGIVGAILVGVDFAVGTLSASVLAPVLGDDLLSGGAGYTIALFVATIAYPGARRRMRALLFPHVIRAKSMLHEAKRELDLEWRTPEVLEVARAALGRALRVDVAIERPTAAGIRGLSPDEANHLAHGEWVDVRGDEVDDLVIPLDGEVILRVPPPDRSRAHTSDERALIREWVEEVQVALERARRVAASQGGGG